MELEMETKTPTAKPEPSIAEDEHSPLIEVNSSETPSQAEPTLDATVSNSGNQDSELSRFCNIFCTIILLIIFLVVIFSLPILPFLLFKKPPDLTPTFHVDSVLVWSLNLSDCQISSNWNISFIVKNPKHGRPMFYDAIRLLVLYENEYLLSIGNVESFYQRGGQESVVKAWLGGSSVNVQKWVVRAMETDRKTRREMDIVLVLDALVTMNPGSEKYRRRLSVKVSCKDLKIGLSSDDTSAGSLSLRNSRNCHLKFEDEP